MVTFAVTQGFYGVLGTRIGSLELKIGSLESAKVVMGSLESEKSAPQNQRNRVPTDPNWVPNIFLKKKL